jgi:hypothetical protein
MGERGTMNEELNIKLLGYTVVANSRQHNAIESLYTLVVTALETAFNN